jgi:two-component system response regulator CpxR
MSNPVVLIVDDDPTLNHMFQEALSIEGYQVEVANNGQEAVEILQRSPDAKRVLLLDIIMPIMDGVAVIRWLGDHPNIRQNLRVVIMTANHRLTEYTHLDHDAVLGKPFGIDLVLNLLSPLG